MALRNLENELEDNSRQEREYGLALDTARVRPDSESLGPRLTYVNPTMFGKDEPMYNTRWTTAQVATQPNFGPIPPVTSHPTSFPTNIGEGFFLHVEDMNNVSRLKDICWVDESEDSWYNDTSFPEMKQYVYAYTSTRYNVMYPNGVVLPIQQNRTVVERLTDFAKANKLNSHYSFFNTAPGTYAPGIMIITYYKIFNINPHNLNRNFTAGMSEMEAYYDPIKQNAMFPSRTVPTVIGNKIKQQIDNRNLSAVKTHVGNMLDRPNGYVNNMYVREIRFIPEEALRMHPNGIFIPSTGLVIGGLDLLGKTQHPYAQGATKASMHMDVSDGASIKLDLVDNDTSNIRYIRVGEYIVPITPRQDTVGRNGLHVKYHTMDGTVDEIFSSDMAHLEEHGVYLSQDACRMQDPRYVAYIKDKEYTLKLKELDTRSVEADKKHEAAIKDLEKINAELLVTREKKDYELQKLRTENARLKTENAKYQYDMSRIKHDMRKANMDMEMFTQKHEMTMEELGAKRYMTLLTFSTEYELAVMNMREKRMDFIWKVQSGILKHNTETMASKLKIQELEAKRDYETSKFMADTSMSSMSIAGKVLKMLSL